MAVVKFEFANSNFLTSFYFYNFLLAISWVGFEIASLHSTINTFMLLLVTPSYREVLLNPYYLIKRKLRSLFRRIEIQIIYNP